MNSMNKEYRIAVLMDIYGNLLTDKQREVMELYYYEDLSLSEIAEHEKITRQGVHDSIKRAEQTLSDLEQKLCVAEKLVKCRKLFEKINTLAQNINDLSTSLGHSENVKLSSEILKLVKQGDDII
jgi:predicted DNA-binding protein YlxM (UPF0122 family)